MIVFSPNAEAGSNLANLLFSLCLLFCGVLAPGTGLGWWIWLYRVNPFTYLVSGMLGVGLGGSSVVCDAIETTIVQPPSGQTCGQYLDAYVKLAESTLYNPDATSDCTLCALSTTDQFLKLLGMDPAGAYSLFPFPLHVS